jgi:hypothetical protein
MSQGDRNGVTSILDCGAIDFSADAFWDTFYAEPGRCDFEWYRGLR